VALAGFTTVTGTTITGGTGQFTSITGGTAGFTTVTGTTVTGTTANFATLSGTTVYRWNGTIYITNKYNCNHHVRCV